MNLHYGVGKAAVSAKYQPRLIVIEYNNNPKQKERYAFVGKEFVLTQVNVMLK